MSIDERQTGGSRWWRYLYRGPLLAVHLLVFLPITLLFVNPLGQRLRIGDESWTERAIRL